MLTVPFCSQIATSTRARVVFHGGFVCLRNNLYIRICWCLVSAFLVTRLLSENSAFRFLASGFVFCLGDEVILTGDVTGYSYLRDRMLMSR